MSQSSSPAIERPYLPLRGRARHIPTKRNFTFPATWRSKNESIEKYAKISETESGRGKIIEPAGGKFLAQHVHESPVPLIISNTETEEEEEEEVERGADDESIGSSSQESESGRTRRAANIYGKVTLDKSGELLLSPSSNLRKRKRNSLKTFDSNEATSPPRNKKKFTNHTTIFKNDTDRNTPERQSTLSSMQSGGNRRSPRLTRSSPVGSESSENISISISPVIDGVPKSKALNMPKTSTPEEPSNKTPVPVKSARASPAAPTPTQRSAKKVETAYVSETPSPMTRTRRLVSKKNEESNIADIGDSRSEGVFRTPTSRNLRRAPKLQDRSKDEETVHVLNQRNTPNKTEGSPASSPSPRTRQAMSRSRIYEAELNEIAEEATKKPKPAQNEAKRKSPRKSMTKSRIAQTPRHSALIEEEYNDEGVPTLPKKDENNKISPGVKEVRARTRQSLITENRRRSERGAVKEDDVTETLMFDENIEGGHFGQRNDKNLSLNSRSMRVPRFESFNVSHPDYVLQRHSTPIPNRRQTRKSLSQLQPPKTSSNKTAPEPENLRESRKRKSTNLEPAEAEPAEEEPSEPEQASEEAVEQEQANEESSEPEQAVEEPAEPEQAHEELPAIAQKEPNSSESEKSSSEEQTKQESRTKRTSKKRGKISDTPKKAPTVKGPERKSLSYPKSTPAKEAALKKEKKGKEAKPSKGKNLVNKTVTPKGQKKSISESPVKQQTPKVGKKASLKAPTKQKPGSQAKQPSKATTNNSSLPGTSFQGDTTNPSSVRKLSQWKKSVIPEPDASMAEQPADVRIWQEKGSQRKFSDINDLDVILERIEERAWDVRESMMDPFSRTVITKFMSKVQRDIRDAIAESHRVTRLTNCVTKLGSQIRRRRTMLLECQQDKAKLKTHIAELKKSQKSPMKCPKSMEDISTFLNDLGEVKREFSKSSPKDQVVSDEEEELEDSTPQATARRSLQFTPS